MFVISPITGQKLTRGNKFKNFVRSGILNSAGELIGKYKTSLGTGRMISDKYHSPRKCIITVLDHDHKFPIELLKIIMFYLNEDVVLPSPFVVVHPYTIINLPRSVLNQSMKKRSFEQVYEIKVPYTSRCSSQHREVLNLLGPGIFDEVRVSYLYQGSLGISKISFIEYRRKMRDHKKHYCHVHKNEHLDHDISIAIPLSKMANDILYTSASACIPFTEALVIYIKRGVTNESFMPPVIPHFYMLCHYNYSMYPINMLYGDIDLMQFYYEGIRFIEQTYNNQPRGLNHHSYSSSNITGFKRFYDFKTLHLSPKRSNILS
uniref:Uncharacterized protein n=1 Tax=Pithovirus LCDPAC01 TaxID=2506600 RepID=A0A481YNA9_9VIRU|nr:MAG: hypothetical protein LCDPAC01_00770 [Pithovirus LCDPAC01]